MSESALNVIGRYRAVEIRRANVYRARGGQIVDVSIFEGTQYDVDELFGAG